MDTNKDFIAFPIKNFEPGETEPRMYMSDYLIAHAPEVPDWFKPNIREMPKVPMRMYTAFGKHSDHQHKDFFMENWDDEAGLFVCNESEVPPELLNQVNALEDRWKEYFIESKKWEEDYRVEKYFQWREYFANEVLKRRK